MADPLQSLYQQYSNLEPAQRPSDPVQAAFMHTLGAQTGQQATLKHVQDSDGPIVDAMSSMYLPAAKAALGIPLWYQLASMMPHVQGLENSYAGTVPGMGIEGGPQPLRQLSQPEKDAITMHLYEHLPKVARGQRTNPADVEDLSQIGMLGALEQMQKGVPHDTMDPQAYLASVAYRHMGDAATKFGNIEKLEGGNTIDAEGNITTGLQGEDGDEAPQGRQVAQGGSVVSGATTGAVVRNAEDPLAEDKPATIMDTIREIAKLPKRDRPLATASMLRGQSREVARQAGLAFDDHRFSGVMKPLADLPTVTPSKIIQAMGASPEEVQAAIKQAIDTAAAKVRPGTKQLVGSNLKNLSYPAQMYLIEGKSPGAIGKRLGYTDAQMGSFTKRLTAVYSDVRDILSKRKP